MSRFYFDGNGNIIGVATNVTAPSSAAGLANTPSTNAYMVPAGTYTVNPDCTANLTLTQGSTTYTFNGVVANNGTQVLIQGIRFLCPGRDRNAAARTELLRIGLRHSPEFRLSLTVV